MGQDDQDAQGPQYGLSTLREMRTAAALVLVLGALLTTAPATWAQDDPPPCPVPAQPVRPNSHGIRFGLVAPLLGYADDQARCAQARLVVDTGARLVREAVAWSDVSPNRGAYRWAALDALFTTTAQQGLTVVPMLHEAPAWARPAPNGLPRDHAAFAAFVAAFVGRYGPAGGFWRAHPELGQRPATWSELFNETYLPPGRPDPPEFARLIRDVVPVARRANPRARFLIPADTSWLDADYHVRDAWLPALFAAVPGFERYFDGVAVHPYSTKPPGTAGTRDASRELNRRVEDIHADLVAAGAGARKLWITEIGWSTCAKRPNCVTPDQQAGYLRDFVALARTRWRSFIDVIVVYTLHSFTGDDEVQNDFGLLEADGTRKPAWAAFRSAAVAAFR
jgi:hypothetical protein